MYTVIYLGLKCSKARYTLYTLYTGCVVWYIYVRVGPPCP